MLNLKFDNLFDFAIANPMKQFPKQYNTQKLMWGWVESTHNGTCAKNRENYLYHV